MLLSLSLISLSLSLFHLSFSLFLCMSLAMSIRLLPVYPTFRLSVFSYLSFCPFISCLSLRLSFLFLPLCQSICLSNFLSCSFLLVLLTVSICLPNFFSNFFFLLFSNCFLFLSIASLFEPYRMFVYLIQGVLSISYLCVIFPNVYLSFCLSVFIWQTLCLSLHFVCLSNLFDMFVSFF